jgi:hypothetical protein
MTPTCGQTRRVRISGSSWRKGCRKCAGPSVPPASSVASKRLLQRGTEERSGLEQGRASGWCRCSLSGDVPIDRDGPPPHHRRRAGVGDAERGARAAPDPAARAIRARASPVRARLGSVWNLLCDPEEDKRVEYLERVRETWRHHELGGSHDPVGLVQYAVMAASSHNTQPWKFKLESGRVRIARSGFCAFRPWPRIRSAARRRRPSGSVDRSPNSTARRRSTSLRLRPARG